MRGNGIKPTLRKPIYSLKAGIEKRFDCIADAAKELNLQGCHISLVANGKQVHTGGYKFRFENGVFSNEEVVENLESLRRCRERTRQKRLLRVSLPERHCNFCDKDLPKELFFINEFTQCKECYSKAVGIKNFGQHQKSIDLFNSGKWKCSDCDIEKELSCFRKCKSYWTGYAALCNECADKRRKEYNWVEQRRTLTNAYVNAWVSQNWNISAKSSNDELRETAKALLLAKRETAQMYALDGKRFSKNGLCKYIEQKYKVGYHAVARRIEMGASEKQCTIPEKEYRQMMYPRTKPIIATHTVTGETLHFENTKLAQKILCIGGSMIRECITTGNPNRLYRNSKSNNTYYFKHGTRNTATKPYR